MLDETMRSKGGGLAPGLLSWSCWVLVIQDASEEVSSSAIKWALHGLSLKPGDMLTLLGVLHLINSPLGYRSRIDSSMFGVNQNIVDMEVAGKKIEYENHGELKELSQLYETHKVELKIEVATGPSPKEVGLKIAQDLKATWIILDRTMKKDRKYFLQKLSCGISRMKRNNSIEQLRGPEDSTEANQNERVRNICLSYDEMIPGSLEHQELFSIELLHPRQTEVIQPSQVEALTQSSGGDEVVVEEWQPEFVSCLVDKQYPQIPITDRPFDTFEAKRHRSLLLERPYLTNYHPLKLNLFLSCMSSSNRDLAWSKQCPLERGL
ncbi:hypothetical protein D5086_002020 [Populus alba]|uniref:Uncharacterized protein n=1 Tax=Populus alba TaxID=43335 RepID=A0ACC4D0I9_POPAL